MNDSVNTNLEDFGVFSELTNHGVLGLVVLALGYVSWMFIKRHLAEKDRMNKEINDLKNKQDKN
jgi:hypothetical protein